MENEAGIGLSEMAWPSLCRKRRAKSSDYLTSINNCFHVPRGLSVNPFIEHRDQLGIGDIRMAALKRRMRIIFQTELYSFCQLLSGNLRHHGQCKVDARCHAAGGDDMAVQIGRASCRERV